MKPILYFLALSCAASTASGAIAAKVPVFDTSPVSTAVLTASYGQYSKTAFSANQQPIAQEGSINALRYAGEINRLIMDNWWADVGATLIANNVRNSANN